MKPFKDYFTSDAIIRELCRLRIKLARKRHDALFFHTISSDQPEAEKKARAMQEDLENLFPSSRVWRKFRPKLQSRHNKDSQTINLVTLERAVRILMRKGTISPWAQNLKDRVDGIRTRALGPAVFEFSTPIIVGIVKDSKKREYRPLALYDTDEKIIEGLTARYLREQFDCVFLPSSMAYRCNLKGKGSAVTTHTALDRIRLFREQHPRIFVAEADIEKFFDCISHDVVISSLKELINEGRAMRENFEISARAIDILMAYLASYTYEAQVLGQGLLDLRKQHKHASFPWPRLNLLRMHGNQSLPLLGVPQGASLSLFIGNLMMHRADRAIARLSECNCSEILYMRYSDDMIIMTPDQNLCSTAMAHYQEALENIKLPLHPPVEVPRYGESDMFLFWKMKSKLPYLWASASDSGIPWVQFVGYQVRYDGEVRIRPKSLKKHIKKLTDETNALLRVINPKSRKDNGIPIYAPGIRKNLKQILHRFRMRLISIGVGRRKLHHGLPNDSMEIKSMCWSNGFRGLFGAADFFPLKC